MAKAENILKGSHRHIRQAYENASIESKLEGEIWYDEARVIAEQVTKLLDTDDLRMGAGIIAALSPQMDWGENIEEAIKFTSIHYSTRQTRANNAKALRILEGENPEDVLGGAKVVAFYHAILEPKGNYPVVVDRHAMRVYNGEPVTKRDLNRVFSNWRVIRRIQFAYRKEARRLGIHPNVLQAITWVHQRKVNKLVHEKAWEDYNITEQETGTNKELEVERTQ